MCLYYKAQLVVPFKKIISVYSENHTKPINTFGQVQLLKFQVGGTYSYHWALKG
jgi:hypothetical protein